MNSNRTILERELESWKTYSDVLRKTDRELFNQMLQSAYKYSNSIEVKGENYVTESLLMSLIFEQHKLLSKSNQQNCLKY